MSLDERYLHAIRKKARRGYSGYPVATVAFYGPTDRSASKVAVGIVLREHEAAAHLERWHSTSADVRSDHGIFKRVLQFIRGHAVKSVVMHDRIIGCPHEEGIDYPSGEACPQCPFWVGRDRWTGEPAGASFPVLDADRPGAPGRDVRVGIAWYDKVQWERLREVAADSETLDDSHDEWERKALQAECGLRERGAGTERVYIVVDDWVAWCQRMGEPLTADSRSRYTAHQVRCSR